MTYSLKISSQNQVTLPVDLLKDLELTSGMYLRINPFGDDYKIINTRKKVAKLAGSLQKYVKDKSKLGLSDEELEKAIEDSKTKYFQSLTKEEILGDL
jgi:hypothetical protein